MAASRDAQWTVLIVAESERSLDKMYQVCKTWRLADVMNMWQEEFFLLGNWKFLSPKGIEYQDWMSLEMVGETVWGSRIVSLRAVLLKAPPRRPASQIFVHHSDKCHLVEVEPEQKLWEVLSNIPVKSSSFQCNDERLNLSATVDQAGLEDRALIHESRRQINLSVKLSHGNIVIIRVPEDSLVHHLYEEIRRYEMDDFSLESEGRHLKCDERVNELKCVIEVTSVQFVVNIRGQRITWTSKSESIVFEDFISQLSLNGKFNEEELGNMEFRCVGCQRCISRMVDEMQLLPIQCCREKSLTLTANFPLDKRLNPATESIMESLQNYYARLLRVTQKAVIESDARDFYRMLQNEMSTTEIQYNAVIRNSEEIRKIIRDLENEIAREKKDDKENLETVPRNHPHEIKNNECININSAGKMEMDSGKDTIIDIQSDIEHSPVGATVGQCHAVQKSGENPNVELYVLFNPSTFTIDVTRPEVQSQGKNSDDVQHLKCAVRGLRPGWATFDEVRDALQSLFAAGEVRVIGQPRFIVDGTTVVVVILSNDDEDGDFGWYSISGHQYSKEEMKEIECKGKVEEKFTAVIAPDDDRMEEFLKTKSWIHVVDKGGKVFIAGGRHRTHLALHDLPSDD